jgi:hypothetical protein
VNGDSLLLQSHHSIGRVRPFVSGVVTLDARVESVAALRAGAEPFGEFAEPVFVSHAPNYNSFRPK